tara:strand:- start:947 stop:2221 length:1275 start_codon:yes stop_codon:yes gene_type:complete
MIIKENRTNSFSRLVKFSIILSIIPVVFTSFFPGKIAIITMLCCYPLIFFRFFLKNNTINFDANFYIRLFQIYTAIVFLRGLMDANSDEDWRVMFSTLIPIYLFVNFSMYLVVNKAAFVTIFYTFFSYCLILSFIILFNGSNAFSMAISPIYIVILMMPYLSKKFKIVILSLALVSFFSDLQNRSNMINIIMAILIAMTFIFKKNRLTLSLMRFSRMIFLTLPVLFLVLGLTGVFNVFLIGEAYSDLKISTASGNDQEILVDSRTGIYADVFKQLVKEDAIPFGLGASGKIETSLVDNINNLTFAEIYKEGRRGAESGMLNYIQWGGLVGGVFYFLLFVKASYYGLFQSKNWFCTMLGLWLAYKGLYSFIEDRPGFSINIIFIFLSIGICLNKEIRQISDYKMKLLFTYIINKTFIFRILSIRK